MQKNDIEDLLKTATEDQLNILKESLGNWADVKRLADSRQSSAMKNSSAQKGSSVNQVLDQKVQKDAGATIEDDDYIEEDFEEDNSDSPIEDATGKDEDDVEERLEMERLE